MKRLAIALITTGLMLMPTTAHAERTWRWNFCRFQAVDNAPWTQREVHLTIHCALAHWPTSHSTADYVASRESGMRATALNTSSGACGVYQSLDELWPGRIAAFNRALPRWNAAPSCFNARSNVLWAIRQAHMGGWGPWSL